MKVIKRDGSVVDYDRSKIATAIGKANAEVPQEERLSQEGIDAIIDRIEGLKRPRMLVEDIQDLVEQGLVAENKFHLAKTYIIYRYNRALVRKANTTDESILAQCESFKNLPADTLALYDSEWTRLMLASN